MLKKDVVKYYGSDNKTGKALGISHQAVGAWRKVIPYKRALKIESLTNGELKFEKELYQ